MKTIFAVCHGCYSDYRVLGTFEDEKTAQAWVDAMNTDEDAYYRDASVEQLEHVEAGTAPFKVTTFNKSADLLDSGEIKEERTWENIDWAINCIYGPPPVRPFVRYVRAPCHNGHGGRLEVRGNSEKAVAHTFGEKVNLWKAGAFGGPSVPELIEDHS